PARRKCRSAASWRPARWRCQARVNSARASCCSRVGRSWCARISSGASTPFPLLTQARTATRKGSDESRIRPRTQGAARRAPRELTRTRRVGSVARAVAADRPGARLERRRFLLASHLVQQHGVVLEQRGDLGVVRAVALLADGEGALVE